MRKTLLVGLPIALIALLIPLLVSAQQQVEHIDLNVIHKIKTTELAPGGNGGAGRGGRGPARPPIMETLYSLTDRYGPRLTNSPQYRAAGDWAVGQLKEWGLSNVHLEPWSTVPAAPAAQQCRDRYGIRGCRRDSSRRWTRRRSRSHPQLASHQLQRRDD